mgnify:CR=1 FL=1
MRSFALFWRQNRCSLTLRHIGYNSSEPIYINENLTKTNSVIMQAATKYRGEGKLTAAYSLRSRVYVRLLNNDVPTLVKTLPMLDDFISTFRSDSQPNNN